MVDMQPVASQSQVQEEGRKKQRLELKADFPAPTLVTGGNRGVSVGYQVVCRICPTVNGHPPQPLPSEPIKQSERVGLTSRLGPQQPQQH